MGGVETSDERGKPSGGRKYRKNALDAHRHWMEKNQINYIIGPTKED